MRKTRPPASRTIERLALRVDASVATGDLPATGAERSPARVALRRADAGDTDLPRDRLHGPSQAAERRRRWFDPASGWFRRLERGTSHLLSRHVFPRVPGMHLPYDRILDRTLTLSEAEIRLRGLPRELDGLSVLLISDVHVGPFVSPAAVRRCFTRLLTVPADVIVVAGDLTTSSLAEFERNREAFRMLDAPLGVFAVLGNHDHYTEDPSRLCRSVEACGIRVLHNRNVELSAGGSAIGLAGVDDLLVGRPDLDAALHGCRSPVVLLSHNPDMMFAARERGVDLVLSGHTHGGQIRAPGLPVLVRQSRFRLDEGHFRSGATQLVVSRGLGAVGVPWRAGCAPEAVLLRLRCDGDDRTAEAAFPGSGSGNVGRSV